MLQSCIILSLIIINFMTCTTFNNDFLVLLTPPSSNIDSWSKKLKASLLKASGVVENVDNAINEIKKSNKKCLFLTKVGTLKLELNSIDCNGIVSTPLCKTNETKQASSVDIPKFPCLSKSVHRKKREAPIYEESSKSNSLHKSFYIIQGLYFKPL